MCDWGGKPSKNLQGQPFAGFGGQKGEGKASGRRKRPENHLTHERERQKQGGKVAANLSNPNPFMLTLTSYQPVVGVPLLRAVTPARVGAPGLGSPSIPRVLGTQHRQRDGWDNVYGFETEGF
jgi:hypothetical protein